MTPSGPKARRLRFYGWFVLDERFWDLVEKICVEGPIEFPWDSNFNIIFHGYNYTKKKDKIVWDYWIKEKGRKY